MNIQCVSAALLLLASFNLNAATFVVNDLGDDPDANPGDGLCDIPAGGPARCTLRAAIMEANATTTVDFIEFSLGLIVINITGTPLPTITSGLWIDATTAPGYNAGAADTLDAPPSVYIDGSALTGTTADGIRSFNTNNIQVKGLGIINFPDNGIELNNGEPALLDSNWIGVGRTGGIGSNGGAGIYLNNFDRAIVGKRLSPSPEVTRGNVISNNGEAGIYLIIGEDAEIAGNYIGSDPVGNADFGNGSHGVHLIGPNNQVGGILNTTDLGNLIESNSGAGVYTQTGGQRIESNDIFFNGGGGVVLNGSSSRIGFNPAQGNVIVENTGHGIHIGNEFASSGNLVRNNISVANTGRGIMISNGNNNEVRENSVALNSNDAVRIDGTNTLLVSNEIGLINDGVFGNGANGVVLNNSGNTVEFNIVGGVDDDGVDIVSGIGNQVRNNQIGMRANGADIGVNNVGVRVRNGPSSTIVSYNHIGHNFDGIALEGSGTRVCGNLIGVGESSQNAGNGSEGVRIDGGGNRVGDLSDGCDSNLIGFNGSDGIQISGDANIIRDNTVGGELFLDLGNLNAGVFLANGSDLNLIEGNSLHHNGNDGIRVASGAGTRNRFDNNNYGENGDQSIDLSDNGPTPNDAGDADSGPNNLQNYPVITNLGSVAGQLEISYRVDSTLANSNYPLTVDFYIVANLQRDIYRIHRDTYNVTPNSVRTILITPPFSTSDISAMVIDQEGNSSELSPPMTYVVTPPPDEIFNDRFELP